MHRHINWKYSDVDEMTRGIFIVTSLEPWTQIEFVAYVVEFITTKV